MIPRTFTGTCPQCGPSMPYDSDRACLRCRGYVPTEAEDTFAAVQAEVLTELERAGVSGPAAVVSATRIAAGVMHRFDGLYETAYRRGWLRGARDFMRGMRGRIVRKVRPVEKRAAGGGR